MPDLIHSTALEVVRQLRAGEVTPIEVLDALEQHVNVTDPEVNSMPIQFFEEARDKADKFLRNQSAPTDRGWLAGLPVAIKDYNDVAGQITSQGSPIFASNRAARSDGTVQILERHGGIPYAKTNVPEIAGGHTYNTVWGATRNPWNLGRTAGGSSGGSAAALASGGAWLATGNDLGGSLRTPSGYNGTVAVRPTPGRVPRKQPVIPYDQMWVEGPMARNVGDAALMLDALVGRDVHDPLTAPPPRRSFVDRLNELDSNLRIGYSPDLGQVAVEQDVRQITARAMKLFEPMGADITTDCPDFTGSYDAFQTLRAHLLATLKADLLDGERDRIKTDIVWNIEKGLMQPLQSVQDADRIRGQLFHSCVDYFESHDVLVVPSAPLNPFPVEWDYPNQVDGVELGTYIDWISITFMITLTSCPVVALPCGLSEEGLPVGVQLVGAPKSEAKLLAVAAEFERSVGIASQLPIAPRHSSSTLKRNAL